MKELKFENKLDPNIQRIFEELYQDFVRKFGEKHSDRIKQKIENISDKVKKRNLYNGGLASANEQMGVVYGKSEKRLAPILKHEMFHVFNEAAFNKDSLAYVPEKYKDVLERNGIIRKAYNEAQQSRIERYKDSPEILQKILEDYETFRENYLIGTGEQEMEKWAQWFNGSVDFNNVNNIFTDWNDGFYTKSKTSAKSFYDYYTNIAQMVSQLIPEEKLLEMFLDTPTYRTGFSYKEMIELFDSTYDKALSEEQKQECQYPYLKVLLDTSKINLNARKNNRVAAEAYQECTEVLFRAYLQKMEAIRDLDEQKLIEIFGEIKDLQEHMMWNLDISQMTDLGYIKVLEQVQVRFKQMCVQVSDKENMGRILQMAQTIDYDTNNPFEKIQNGNEISDTILESENNDELSEVQKLGDYKYRTTSQGIKGNIYRSIRALLGDEIFNLIFRRYQNDKISFLTDSTNGNKLAILQDMIQGLPDDMQSEETLKQVERIYNYIYELYAHKMEDKLLTDENIDNQLKKTSNEIVVLQENALVDTKSKKYMPSLEKIIALYQQKIEEYKRFITISTEEEIKEVCEREGEDDRRDDFTRGLANREYNALENYIKALLTSREFVEQTVGEESTQGEGR